MIIDELKNIHLYKNIIPKEIIEDIKGNLNGEPQGEIVKNFITWAATLDGSSSTFE